MTAALSDVSLFLFLTIAFQRERTACGDGKGLLVLWLPVTIFTGVLNVSFSDSLGS